jgi:hypothetical protein
MAALVRSMDFVGSPAAAEELWFDPARWPSWVDGFGHVVRVDSEWPGVGAVLVWESLPHGRGRVLERVLEHQPGRGQTLEVSDERLTGHQRVEFEELEGGVAIALSLDYRLRQGAAISILVDRLFVRRALGDSMRRTLSRFGRELAADRALLR